MGQTLSEPVVEKHTSFDQDDTLVYAVSEMQGWRMSMEDAHATILNLNGATGAEKISFFGVYDGHGGAAVAKFTGSTLHDRLANNDDFKEQHYRMALKSAFLETDEALKADPSFASDPSGCTAVVALFVPSAPNDGGNFKDEPHIIVANAGDSRSVLAVSGQAKPMSLDHKPTNESERWRITRAGGFIECDRVNGNLALSRAIGDFEFKRNPNLSAYSQIVTANPDVKFHHITGEEEFLVIACDGIWDCLSNQQVVDVIRRSIAKGKELQAICEDLMDRCLAPDIEYGGVGSDNMTVCIVAILGGRTKAEWYEWVKERVESNVGWETPEDVPCIFGGQGRRNSEGDIEDVSGEDGIAGALSGAGNVYNPYHSSLNEGLDYRWPPPTYRKNVGEENDDESEQSFHDQEVDETSQNAPEIVESPREDSRRSSVATKTIDSAHKTDDMPVDEAEKSDKETNQSEEVSST